jgi:hypothetical protein
MKRDLNTASAVDQERLELQSENAKFKSIACDQAVELVAQKKRAFGKGDECVNEVCIINRV